MRKWPYPEALLDDRPSMEQAPRFEDHEEDDDSAQEQVHRGKDDLAADLAEEAHLGNPWTKIGDKFLEEPDHDRSDDGPQEGPIPPTINMPGYQTERKSVNISAWMYRT